MVEAYACADIRFNRGLQVDVVNGGNAETLEFGFRVISGGAADSAAFFVGFVVGVVGCYTEIAKVVTARQARTEAFCRHAFAVSLAFYRSMADITLDIKSTVFVCQCDSGKGKGN